MNVIKFYKPSGEVVRIQVSQSKIACDNPSTMTTRKAYMFAIQKGWSHRRLK